jgi:multidrug resistance protein, MATE family
MEHTELQPSAQPSPGIGSGPLTGRLFKIALPLVFNQGSVILMMFADRMFLSWYGTAEISAVWPATFLYMACSTLFYGVTAFINIYVAQFHGAGNKKMCSATVWQGAYLAVAAYLIMLCVIPLGRHSFDWFGHQPEIAGMERTYYTVMMCAAIMPMMNNNFASFFTGRGLTHVTMASNVAGNALNIFLDWVLIFGHLGAPRMGILGAAVATAISSALPPLIMFILFLNKRNHAEFDTRGQRKVRPKLMKKFLRLGLPSSIHDLTYYIAAALFFMLMGKTLPESLAANNIAWSINELLTLYIHGLTLANTTLLAQCIGAGRPEEGERLTYLVIKVLLGLATVIGVAYVFFGAEIYTFFRPRVEGGEDVPFALVRDKGQYILLLLICYNFFYAFVYTFRQALRGAGDISYFPKVSLLVDLGLFIPGMLITVKIFGTSYAALWGWFLIYLAVLGAVHFIRFRRGHWKHFDRGELNEVA